MNCELQLQVNDTKESIKAGHKMQWIKKKEIPLEDSFFVSLYLCLVLLITPNILIIDNTSGIPVLLKYLKIQHFTSTHKSDPSIRVSIQIITQVPDQFRLPASRSFPKPHEQ